MVPYLKLNTIVIRNTSISHLPNNLVNSNMSIASFDVSMNAIRSIDEAFCANGSTFNTFNASFNEVESFRVRNNCSFQNFIDVSFTSLNPLIFCLHILWKPSLLF